MPSKKSKVNMYLDYDNLELKMLTDVIASHTTMTDAPYRLNSYCCSAQGEKTHMEFFLIPLEDFPLEQKQLLSLATTRRSFCLLLWILVWNNV